MLCQCPKGHQSTDPDYCSECGALIGQNKKVKEDTIQNSNMDKKQNPLSTIGEICPDCGTPREGSARFCEVCRHDFQDNKTGVAEAIIASKKADNPSEDINKAEEPAKSPTEKPMDDSLNTSGIKNPSPSVKLNVVISVDKDKVSSWDGESHIKPDSVERIFPLDLDENLVGRRSEGKGIFPEIEINDPGVSHRHLKFIKQATGGFAVLELGSSNGTELNGAVLEPGVNADIKPGDELTIGIWTRLKIIAR